MRTDKNNQNNFVFNDAVMFDLIVFLFFLVIAIGSFDYNPRDRSIPLGLGILGATMMFLQLLSDSIPAIRSKLRFVSQSGLLGEEAQNQKKDLSKTEDKVAATEQAQPGSTEKETTPAAFNWEKVFRLLLWLLGFIVLLSFANYLIAVGLFLVLITRFEAKESWKRAFVLAVCVNVCFFILFDLILNVQL
ncbi:tripartite tricarboxylate transporter TctB family protein [Thermodesulfobacteriota bacterium]